MHVVPNATSSARWQRELPVTIDLLGVAIAAGCTPYLAVGVASAWSPPVVGARLGTAVRRCELGAGFAAALDDAADDAPGLRPLADALLASDRFGAPVADALSRLAADERAALRRRAEAACPDGAGSTPVPPRLPRAPGVRAPDGGADAPDRLRRSVTRGGLVREAPESGQTTAEYALVILGAAAVAFALAKWAAGGAISKLFDDVISKIL